MATNRTLPKQTKTFTMKPEEIPANYVDQIADLLWRYLQFKMAPDALIPYFSRAYSRFYLTTSADGKQVLGCAGINVLEIDGIQMVYLGAVVVEAGSRGTAALYQPIFRDVLRHRLACPHQKSYLFGAIVNPYAYAAMARRFGTLYPSPAHPTLGTEMLELAASGLTKLYGTGLDFDRTQGLVRPPVAMAPVAEKPLDSRNTALNFYAERNPGYREGVGLIYAVPLSLGTFAGVWRSLRTTRV
jgi:hypothetical protein